MGFMLTVRIIIGDHSSENLLNDLVQWQSYVKPKIIVTNKNFNYVKDNKNYVYLLQFLRQPTFERERKITLLRFS